MTTDLMIDLETLALEDDAVVVQVGVVAFGPATHSMIASLKRDVDVYDALMHGFQIDPGTVHWWREQSPLARSEVYSHAIAWRDVWSFCKDRLSEDGLVWANSPQFDLVKCHRNFAAHGRKAPWTFRQEADLRTLKNVARRTGVDTDVGDPTHDALDDCARQIEILRQLSEQRTL